MSAARRSCAAALFALLFCAAAAGEGVGSLIIEPALSLKGAAYASGAAGPGRFDCSGFVTWLYKPHVPSLPRSSRDMAGTGVPVKRSELLPGDLVFFATGSSPAAVTHVAVYIGQDSLVHAISNGPDRGVTVTPLSSRYWDRRYHSSRRVLPERFYAAEDGEVSGRAFAKGSYSGETEKGEPEGKGSVLLANGDRYEGEFGDGMPHGEGVYTWKNGDRYSGSFRRGAVHGAGVLRLADGTEISARWNDGRRAEGGGTAGRVLTTYYRIEDSPWESFNGIVEGDYDLWRRNDEESFEAWKKDNRPAR